MATIEPVKIRGLKEFRNQLKDIDADLPKGLRLALNQAADIVVAYARPRVPKRTGRAQRSVKAKSSRVKVRVSGGGNRASYYPWLDFGGHVGRGRSVVRPFLREGRYIYKGYFVKRDSGEFGEVLSKALVGLAESAGLQVTEGGG